MHFLSHSLSFLDNVICIGKGLYVVKPKFSKNKTPDPDFPKSYVTLDDHVLVLKAVMVPTPLVLRNTIHNCVDRFKTSFLMDMWRL